MLRLLGQGWDGREGENGGARRWFAFAGLTPAIFAAAVSLTPSLMPRDALFQGVVAGLAGGAAYGGGLLVAHVVNRYVQRWLSSRALMVSRVLLLTAGTALFGFWLWRWVGWQAEVHALAGKPAPGRWAPLVVALVYVVLLTALVAVGRLLHAGGRLLSRPVRRVVPACMPVSTAARISTNLPSWSSRNWTVPGRSAERCCAWRCRRVADG